MDEKKRKNKSDFPFRLFLLELLTGRELSIVEIEQAIQRDYPQKEISRERLKDVIEKLRRFKSISRREDDESRDDNCTFVFTTTRHGLDKIRYFKEQIKEGDIGRRE